MFPFANDRPSRARRVRRQAAPSAVESLEGRQLLTFSPLGFSPPDLIVVGQAPVVAAWGGPITVSADVINTGAASLIEPLALPQGFPTRATAGPSVVGVYLSPNPHRLGPGAIRIGEIAVPGVQQAGVVTVSETFVLPGQPPRFPGNGGNVYVYFRADDLRQAIDFDRTNNIARAPEPLRIAAPLPELVATAIELPPVIQPGDAIAPAFRIANFGTTGLPPQGPLLVQLVASTDQDYGPTDVILASYFIEDVPPLSTVPVSGPVVLGLETLDIPANVLTIFGPQIILPPGPDRYFIGLIVDPLNQVREVTEIDRGPSPALAQVRPVGPPIPGLPPAGIVAPPASPTNVFPIPPYGPIFSPFQPPEPLIVFEGSPGSPDFPVEGAQAQSLARGANGRRIAAQLHVPAARRPGDPTSLPRFEVPGGPRMQLKGAGLGTR